MKKISSIPLLIILMFPSACVNLSQRMIVKKCRFSLEKVEVGKFSLSGMTLGIYISIYNPNKIDAVIDKMELDLYIEGQKTVHIAFDGVTVPHRTKKTINAMFDIPYSAIGVSSPETALMDGTAHYKLAGTIYMNSSVGVLTFPVTISKD
jgi:LEA14-like dessication related protein